MTITISPISENEIVTGYTIGGKQTDLEQQITALTMAVSWMTPTGTTHELNPEARSAQAMLTLQLLALMKHCKDETVRTRVIRVLRGMYVYLAYQRNELISRHRLSKEEAERRVTPGFGYFDYDWPKLFGDDAS